MDHDDLSALRRNFDQQRILLCFNGPFSQSLIEEIGNALRSYLQSESASSAQLSDVFGCYIEITQNIRSYAAARQYDETAASATVVIGRDAEHRYQILAGNVVDAEDIPELTARIGRLATMDKVQLKQAYKEQLRKPAEPGRSAGLGLIDLARKSSAPLTYAVRPTQTPERLLFSLSVVV